jgi:type II secretory pathway pseudopilin PulG
MVMYAYTLFIFNSNLKKRQSQLGAGFIMLEVAVAVVLVSLFSFFLLSWQTNFVNIQQAALQRARALSLACASIERYRAAGIWHEYIAQEKELREFTLTHEYKQDKVVHDFGWIRVKVTWKERAFTRSIELYTGVQSKNLA